MVSVHLLKIFIICWAISTTCFANSHLDPDWIDPHAWSDDENPLSQLCPKSEPCKPCENKATPEYLRLVNTFFDPDAFRFEKTTNFFHRTLHIHATKEQLENIRKSKDTLQIDGLISEILAQSEFGMLQLVKEYTTDIVDTLWNRFPDWNSNILPRSQTVFTNFTLFLITYFVCRRYNISFLIAVFFASIYFLFEYLDYECHQRIELNEAVDFIYGKRKNPCASPARGNWFDWVMGRDSRTLCREYLAKQTRTTRNQCGIVDLFHEFTINVILKQLKLFIMSISELVQSISTTKGILITVVTLYFMKGILTTIIHSMFQFVLNPTIWSRVVADLTSTPSMESRPSTSQLRQIQDEDIRDANLSKALDIVDVQLKLLLTQKSTQIISVSQPSAVEILPISDTTEQDSTNDISPNSLDQVSGIEPADEHDISASNEGVIAEMTENNVNIFVVDRSPNDFTPLTRSSSQSSSVFVVDRSRSEYILYPPLIVNSTDSSEKSSSSDSNKLDSDIEFVPNFSTSTMAGPNLNSS